MEAELAQQREIEYRLAHQRELELQREIEVKARLEEQRITALNLEINGVRDAIEAERRSQAQLHD